VEIAPQLEHAHERSMTLTEYRLQIFASDGSTLHDVTTGSPFPVPNRGDEIEGKEGERLVVDRVVIAIDKSSYVRKVYTKLGS
jgi:hypothetical protein